MVKEAVEGLRVKEDGIYVDITYGAGGHAREILKRLGKKGRLYAFDQDEDALKNAIADERLTLIQANFRFVKNYTTFYEIQQVDGILGDFGVSSHQLDTPERGFSTRFEAPLDMRMSQKSALSAHEVVNSYEESRLQDLFRRYGELRNAGAIAKAMVAARPVKTTHQLNKALEPLLPEFKRQKILAQVYQALRIEVNQELEAIQEFLLQTPELLKKGGRLCLLSYHSLEDRLVKRFIRSGRFEGEAEKDLYGNVDVPFKKVDGLITPSEAEIQQNPRARSARLRIAERL